MTGFANATRRTHKGQARVDEILDAARRSIEADGYSQLSMRGVAARTGITLGSLQHYFASKEALIEATLSRTLDALQSASDRMAHTRADARPADQLREALRYFARVVRSPAGQSTFAELKVMALRDPFARQVMRQVMTRARRSIGRRILALGPALSPKELHARAGLVLAQLMGLSYLEGDASDAIEIMLSTALGRLKS